MLFNTAILLLLVSSILADKTFDAVTVRTGTQFQAGSISIHDGVAHINDGPANIQYVLKDDGSLYDNALNKYLVINDNGDIGTSDNGSTKFSLKDGYLTIDGKGFYASPDGDIYKLSTVEHQGTTTPVAIFVNNVQDTDGVKTVQPIGTAPSLTTVTPIGTAPSLTTVTPLGTATQVTLTPLGSVTTTVTPTTTFIKGVEKTIDAVATAKLEPVAVNAVIPSFGLISIHSGSDVQNAGIKKVDSHAQVFLVGGSEGEDLKLTLSDDGKLYDQTGRGVFVGENGDIGNVDPWGQQQPTSGFSVKDGHLYFQDKQSFYACPSGPGKYSLTTKGWDGCTGIALRLV